METGSVPQGLFDTPPTDPGVFTQAFNQEDWSRAHYPAFPGTLCAGLSYFWLQAKLRGLAPFDQLHTPSPDLLKRIQDLQAQSYYPNFPPDFTPGDRDKTLLTRKYGSADWEAIKREVNDRYAGDFVLYDLAQLFRFGRAHIQRFTALPSLFPCWPSLAPNSIVLLLFRHLHHGQSSGHRMAYYLDHAQNHHFFDSNNGAAKASDAEPFQHWLDAFFSDPRLRNAQPAEPEPRLTLYVLEDAALFQD